MTNQTTPEEVEELYTRLRSEAKAGGYHLNPDEEFTRDLTEALITNTRRYGYQSCPCRLADGTRDKDLDIICPCDYRDPDLAEFGACYCALYVSGEIADGKAEAGLIPERRKRASDTETRGRGDAEGESDAESRNHHSTGSGQAGDTGGNPERERGGVGAWGKSPEGATGRLNDGEKELDYPVWRCPVCGYLCAREHPPEKCPICKADKDRFKRFM